MALFGRKSKQETDFSVLPKHLGIIMDGNGRWAKKRLLPRNAGHRQGAKTFKNIVDYANKIGIKYLTAYAFSTENWKRPKNEVDALMKLLEQYLDEMLADINQQDIKLTFIGDETPLSDNLKEKMHKVSRQTAEHKSLHVMLALNYGGRDEITGAVKKIAESVKNGKVDIDAITPQLVGENLYTAGVPDPDIIIRPSGEMRLSNFLLWQAAYSEFWYSKVLWPDFTPHDLDLAIEDFNKRQRRFGGI